MARTIVGVCLLLLVGLVNAAAESPPARPADLPLGAFSVSLTVKDLAASQAFYEKLGFRAVLGDPAAHWLILRNGSTTIGLFQGMFERNMLTFNPGWDAQANALAEFRDVRDLQRELVRRGLQPIATADEASTGPASLMLLDPDGNPVLLDQHVARAAPTAGAPEQARGPRVDGD